jgi:hypothetical protein
VCKMNYTSSKSAGSDHIEVPACYISEITDWISGKFSKLLSVSVSELGDKFNFRLGPT